MSRILNILVEGQTELEFVKNLICPHLLTCGISNVRPISIETSPGCKGGDVRYPRYKKNIQKILHQKEDLIVTSLIDYYRLPNDFPNYDKSRSLANATPQQKVELIEQGCRDDINDERERFIPYIQLHEFEGLLFSAPNGFEESIPDLSKANKKELLEIVKQFPNPELINNSPENAPSRRLERWIPNYKKPLHGIMIAQENGFNRIMERCPRFNQWISTLITRIQA